MNDILHQFQIRASLEAVFDEFTSPEGLNAWWTLEAAGKPELNEVYKFYFGPAFDWRAVVVHVVAGQELTWKFTQAMDDWLPTSLGFRLSSLESGCKVQFFHTDWPNAGEHFAISNFCWGQLLQGLKNYVERGLVVPFEQRN